MQGTGMEMSHEVLRERGRDVLVVTFAGEIAPGSEGNPEAKTGTEYIEANLTDEHAAFVVNLTDLNYVFGNYVGQWCIVPAKRWRVPARFVATGRTAKALVGLLGTSGLERILGEPMLHPSVSSAVSSLPWSEPPPH